MCKKTRKLVAFALATALLLSMSPVAMAVTPPVDWGNVGAPAMDILECHYDFAGGTLIRYNADGNLEAVHELTHRYPGYYLTVAEFTPWRIFHRFDGWQAADGTIYHAGDQLPNDVTELRAVWVRTWVLPTVKIPWK